MNLSPTITITEIKAPDTGRTIIAHCVHCRSTVILWSPFRLEPDTGGVFVFKGTCVDKDLWMQHNIYPQFDFPNPSRMGPRPEEWTPEAYAAYWNKLGVQP